MNNYLLRSKLLQTRLALGFYTTKYTYTTAFMSLWDLQSMYYRSRP